VDGDVVLVTDRLLLRHWRESDAAVQHELWSERDPRVPPHRRLDAAGHPTVTELADRIRSGRTPRELLLVELRTGGVLGYCGLVEDGSADRVPELAYELLQRFWGQGYATEAATAVVDRARAAGHERIRATVRDWNIASRRVLAKLGFRETGDVEPSAQYGDSLITVKEL
jgi:[ribosomal protein S5]-alanine N-acetyltransferase